MNKEFSKLKEVILYFIIDHCHTMYVMCVYFILFRFVLCNCIFTTRRHTIIKDLVLLYKKSYPTSNIQHLSHLLDKNLKKGMISRFPPLEGHDTTSLN